MNRRVLLGASVGLLTLTTARAQRGWPERPVRLVVAFPAGNTADIVARILADGLSSRLGQPVVVENRAGAAGTLATEAVARATDGHTFLLTTASPLVISPAVQRVAYDPLRDFRPIARLGSIAVMLIARRELEVENVSDLVALLRRTRGGLDYASVGPGTFSHLSAELFRTALGVEMNHVPYRGAGAAHADLLGGRIALMFDSIASANAQVAAGRLRGLAVTTAERSPFAPDIPTLRESGLPELAAIDVGVWCGLLGPASTPDAVAARLVGAAQAELTRPEVRGRLEAQSITPGVPEQPEVFARALADEVALWARVAREARLDVG